MNLLIGAVLMISGTSFAQDMSKDLIGGWKLISSQCYGLTPVEAVSSNVVLSFENTNQYTVTFGDINNLPIEKGYYEKGYYTISPIKNDNKPTGEYRFSKTYTSSSGDASSMSSKIMVINDVLIEGYPNCSNYYLNVSAGYRVPGTKATGIVNP